MNIFYIIYKCKYDWYNKYISSEFHQWKIRARRAEYSSVFISKFASCQKFFRASFSLLKKTNAWDSSNIEMLAKNYTQEIKNIFYTYLIAQLFIFTLSSSARIIIMQTISVYIVVLSLLSRWQNAKKYSSQYSSLLPRSLVRARTGVI